MLHRFEKQNGITMHDYQKEGIKWCVEQEKRGVEINKENKFGGLICDEMGLGKTYQILGTILSNYLPKTLIVVPKILLNQWKEIFIKKLNHNILYYHGVNKNKITDFELKKAPIVLTSYHMLLTQKKELHNKLQMIVWDRVIFDEAHHLRGKDTKLHLAGDEIKSKIKWLITGTPIQNKKEDLYSLLKILKIENEYLKSNLDEVLEKVMLKRTKQDVGLKLPVLKEHVIYVKWKNEKEKKQAENIHKKLKFSNLNSNEKLDKNEILKQVIKCKQSCVDLNLVKDVDNNSHTKLNRVVEFIKERKREKKLIFCHFNKEIEYLTNQLSSDTCLVKYFNGKVSNKKREEILKSKIDILILQIQTGCEGLNLQQFNEVYFVSPSWNPAIESQAIARCHRIGQKNPINVFRFKMEPFDNEYNTKSLDMHSSICQLKKKVIANVLDNKMIKSDNICCICMENIEYDKIEKLACSHIYHNNCILEWYKTNLSCPTCRQYN
jgi:SNF2 family DNA or RNA helicase